MKNLYLKYISLTLSLLILSGCSLGDKESSKENPDFIVQISNLDISALELSHHFGDVTTASKTQKIVINNDTSDPIGMNAYIEQPSPFVIQRSDCGASLAAGKSCFVNVVFSTRGLFDDTQETTSLILEDDKTIGLSAVVKNGKTPPSATETNLVFEGELPTPENPIRNVYLRNIGLGNATIQELTFDDNVVKRFDACPVGKILKPKESCRIQLIIPRDERSSFESTSYEIKYADATNPGKTLSPNDGGDEGEDPEEDPEEEPPVETVYNVEVELFNKATNTITDLYNLDKGGLEVLNVQLNDQFISPDPIPDRRIVVVDEVDNDDYILDLIDPTPWTLSLNAKSSDEKIKLIDSVRSGQVTATVKNTSNVPIDFIEVELEMVSTGKNPDNYPHYVGESMNLGVEESIVLTDSRSTQSTEIEDSVDLSSTIFKFFSHIKSKTHELIKTIKKTFRASDMEMETYVADIIKKDESFHITAHYMSNYSQSTTSSTTSSFKQIYQFSNVVEFREQNSILNDQVEFDNLVFYTTYRENPRSGVYVISKGSGGNSVKNLNFISNRFLDGYVRTDLIQGPPDTIVTSGTPDSENSSLFKYEDKLLHVRPIRLRPGYSSGGARSHEVMIIDPSDLSSSSAHRMMVMRDGWRNLGNSLYDEEDGSIISLTKDGFLKLDLETASMSKLSLASGSLEMEKFDDDNNNHYNEDVFIDKVSDGIYVAHDTNYRQNSSIYLFDFNGNEVVKLNDRDGLDGLNCKLGQVRSLGSDYSILMRCGADEFPPYTGISGKQTALLYEKKNGVVSKRKIYHSTEKIISFTLSEGMYFTEGEVINESEYSSERVENRTITSIQINVNEDLEDLEVSVKELTVLNSEGASTNTMLQPFHSGIEGDLIKLHDSFGEGYMFFSIKGGEIRNLLNAPSIYHASPTGDLLNFPNLGLVSFDGEIIRTEYTNNYNLINYRDNRVLMSIPGKGYAVFNKDTREVRIIEKINPSNSGDSGRIIGSGEYYIVHKSMSSQSFVVRKTEDSP